MDKQSKIKTYKAVIAHFLVKHLVNPNSPLSKDILKMMVQRTLLNMNTKERAEFIKKLENNPSELIDIINEKITTEDKELISEIIQTKFTKALINTSNSFNN